MPTAEPVDAPHVAETPTMRVVDMLLPPELGRLPAFLAMRRAPGPDWTPYETIAHQIYSLTHMSVSRETVRLWCIRYGIPEWASVNGRRGEPTRKELSDYRKAVARYVTLT